jgi:uncharacterized membrane protein
MNSLDELNKLKLHRMIFFTDAVLAIILTLLVIELHLPSLSNAKSASEMLQGLQHMLPQFASFLLAFSVVASAWLGMNVFQSIMIKYDNTLGILNILLLLILSLMPFAAKLIGDYFYNPVSYLFLGSIALIGSAFQSSIVRYIYKKKMISPLVDEENYKKRILQSVWFFPFITACIIAMAFVNTTIAFSLFMFMNISSIVTMRWLKLTIEKE